MTRAAHPVQTERRSFRARLNESTTRRRSAHSRLAVRFLVFLLLSAGVAGTQSPTPPASPQPPQLGISFGDNPDQLGTSMQILLLLTLLTLLPAFIASLTPFLRILVVLHFLRQAIGTQTAPGNQTLIGLALFLTVVLMRPVADQVHAEAIVPLPRISILALVPRQYTPASPRIPRLFALNPAHHLRR